MRATLHALTAELRRLQVAGVKTIAVSDEALAMLRKLVGNRTAPPTGGRNVPVATDSSDRFQSVDPPIDSSGQRPAPLRPQVAAATPSRLPAPPQVVLPAGADKQTRWDALLAQVTRDPVCLAQLRPGKKVVLGVGSLDARIFFCGEAPGAEEELRGEPFVGPAGQLLTKMISAMGLHRREVYIGNIMNWRPQLPHVDGQEQLGNRPPDTAEMAYCLPFLRAQLDIVQPDVIVALGSTAAKGLLGEGSFKALGEIRGRWQSFADVPVMVTYHPSYILRNQSNRSKRAIWEDLLQVMERAGLSVSEKQRGYFLGH